MPSNECSGLAQLEPVCHIVTPVGMLGYGFDETLTFNALAQTALSSVPTAIILDSGSTDSGPEKLAFGTTTCPLPSYERDLRKLISLAHRFRVPVITSSAGGSGSAVNVNALADIVKRIVREPENGCCSFELLTVDAELPKSLVNERLEQGAVSPCGTSVPTLRQSDIDDSPRIVAQMGPEPLIQAMQRSPNFNICLAGRAYDPSPYVAWAAIQYGIDVKEGALTKESQRIWGSFTHMGKILECGGQCATPKSNGAMATLYRNGVFDISPLDPNARYILFGPGGFLDLNHSTYEPLSDRRTVRVRNSLFKFSRDMGLPYQLKLEAAKTVGYRSMYIGSIKDSILTSQIDLFLDQARKYAALQHQESKEFWDLDFHIYGPDNDGEIFLIGEALASTQALASSVASCAKVATIHGPYRGQKATSGNFCHGIGGRNLFDLGETAEFSIYHLLNLQPGEEGLAISDDLSSNPTGLFHFSSTHLGQASPPLLISSCPYITTPPIPEAKTKASGKLAALMAALNKPSFPALLPTSPTLSDVATVIRSKAAGPFEITFDVLFSSKALFNAIRESEMLGADKVAKVLGFKEDQLVWCGFFEPACGFKVTVPRMRKGKARSAGGWMENDVHGAQMYLPLGKMEVPEDFRERVRSAWGLENGVVGLENGDGVVGL